jgi:hypothetical protein
VPTGVDRPAGVPSDSRGAAGLPKYGPVKINKLLSRCRIVLAKTIGGLTKRKRNELGALPAD